MAQDRKTMLQDQEALQIVLENLSCFNLNNTAGRLQLPNQLAPVGTFYNVTERNSAQSQCQLAKFDIRNPAPGTAAVPNVTEHVTVPSSEHVAEIVGRQGEVTSSIDTFRYLNHLRGSFHHSSVGNW